MQRDFTVDNGVGDLGAIIDHLEADAVHYCGESMGGILGMVLAATHAKRVRTLTLVSSPVNLNQTTQTTYALGQPSGSDAQKAMGMKAWVAATNRTTRFPANADPAAARLVRTGVFAQQPRRAGRHEPRACATHPLHFAAAHDGVACHEA